MSDQNPNKDLNDLERRLKDARGRETSLHDGPAPGDGDDGQGFGQAIRIGAELVSALIVGTGIGWFLDQWLDTQPFLMIVFFFLGSAAGILNVYRSTGLLDESSPSHPGAVKSGQDSKDLETPGGAWDDDEDEP